MSCWWRWGDGGVNYTLILSQAESRSVCGAETSIHNCSREHSTWLVSLAFHRHSSYLESKRSGPLSCHLFIYFNCKAQHCKKKKSWNAVKHKTDGDRLLFRLDGSLFLSGRFGVGQGGGPDAILSGHRPLIDKLLTIITFWQSFSIQTIAASLEFTGLAVQETNRPITSAANHSRDSAQPIKTVHCVERCVSDRYTLRWGTRPTTREDSSNQEYI